MEKNKTIKIQFIILGCGQSKYILCWYLVIIKSKYFAFACDFLCSYCDYFVRLLFQYNWQSR